MRHFHRLIIATILIFSSSAYALDVFLDGIYWRATETNDWAYLNSLTVPNQTLNYKTIDFDYTPGFRVGAKYISNWDALFSYTEYYTTMHDSASGNVKPAFLGSVTAEPKDPLNPNYTYFYQSGQVNQSINYNIFDLDVGKEFKLASALMVHPIIGLMGGWIDQSIHAGYSGPTSSNEYITNDFTGIGPKAGVDTSIVLSDYNNYRSTLIASFATSYLSGHWNIKDVTNVTPTKIIFINGASHSMGALVIQGSLGAKLEYHHAAIKLLYEMNDWFDQTQIFDNDTGTHNNDLILQGLTLGFSYDF